MLAWFYSDVYCYPELTWNTVGVVEQWAYPAAAVFVFSLSVIWALPTSNNKNNTVDRKKGQ